jgi:hypothetical protein
MLLADTRKERELTNENVPIGYPMLGRTGAFPKLRSRSLSLWESFGIGMQSKKRPDEPFVSVRIVSE